MKKILLFSLAAVRVPLSVMAQAVFNPLARKISATGLSMPFYGADPQDVESGGE